MFNFYLLTVIFANSVKCRSNHVEGAYCKYSEKTKDHDESHFG
jgi:hypothetical protein